MGGDLDSAVRKIDELASAVTDGEIGSTRLWGGVGVCVVRKRPAPRPDNFYPEPRYVVTPFAGELSWLIKELWAGFRPVLDPVTKVEFFGRLGNAATDYHVRKGPDASVRGVLEAVLSKARSIATEIGTGTFEALHVAPGRAIAEDFLAPKDHAQPRPT